MSPRKTKHCLFLLLVVLAGHASLTLHVNSHVAAEQQTCHLCTHYSGFEHAIPPAAAAAFPAAFVGPEPVTPAAFAPAAEASRYRQRAPPIPA